MRDGVVLMISNDFPPVSRGQSRYLYDLWSCLPPEEVVVMAPAIEGADEVDAGLACRVVRVPLRLTGSRLSKVFKTQQLLAAAWKFCRLLQDDALRQQLAAQGRQRVQLEFDRRVQAARLWEACG